MHKKDCDILIIGGGIVGLSLAKGLDLQGVSYLLVDENLHAIKTFTRPLALSKTSIAILKYLKVWDAIREKATAIQKIHVSAEGQYGYLQLEEECLENLGVVINLNDLQQSLIRELEPNNRILEGRFLDYLPEQRRVIIQAEQQKIEIHAKLIIAADGALSSVREKCGLPIELEKEQEALIGILSLKKPHFGQAFERFTHLGPLALLPWQTHDMAIVWSLMKKDAFQLQQKNFADLPQMITEQLANRMGDILEFSSIRTYPLRQIFMPIQMFQNILFLGNAAHTLHPVAGQGFNLSLRDVVIFLDMLKKHGFTSRLFPIYLLKRRDDQRFTQYLTQFLAGGFNRLPGVLKGLSFCALSHHPRLKKLFSHYAQGLGYPLPVEVYQFLEAGYE